jgi:hypothetical protein
MPPYADPEKQKEFVRNYYAKPENKEKNRLANNKRYAETKNQLINYWRKKYMFTFGCSELDCCKLTMEQMKEDIASGLCRV